MKIIKILLVILVIATSLLGGRMFWLAKKSSSSSQAQLGVENNSLKVCGKKPNCVSSAADKNSESFIAPLTGSNIEGLWDNLNILLPEMGFEIASDQKNYLHVTATSKIFGFVDDMEFLLQPDQGIIEMRSQSRVGYSDMGANKKRLEKIRAALQTK